jgi:uncharacterized repeat protein (TIGR01451 family)
VSISFYSVPAARCARAWVIAGLLALCCIAPAWAVPTVSTNTSFVPADPARSSPDYMDSGGVWNGSAEVTNTTGDTFSITISNSAAGTPNPLVNDVAFDIALTLNVPAGFRLPVSPFTVATSATGGDPGAGNCVAPGSGSITATQAGGVGTPITFNFPANTNLPAQGAGAQPCRYTLSFGLTTSNVAPFVAAGTHTLNYSFLYNTVDNTPASQQITAASQNIAVERGDVIVTKTAVPNPANLPEGSYADGETAQWTVSLFNNGTGGTFAVLLTDTLNVNFNAASLQLVPPASPPGTPFPVPQGANQYTLNYLSPGATGQVDIAVQAQIAVPVGASSCPDLRNDVSVIDRLQNTSSAFASVVLNLEDPLLSYTPPNFIIDFGTPETVAFDVDNAGSGAARNVQLAVPGLSGVTISNVSAEWIYDVFSSTFIHVGLDGFQASGDETIPAGGSSQLQFDAEMNTCGGSTGAFLTWTPSYQNICGLNFTFPEQSSSYSVNNFPDLTINKSVSPSASSFGVAGAFYMIDLIGSNVGSLETVAGTDNDWQVIDALPAGVGSGFIATVPAGTIITVGATTYTDADTNIPVAGGDAVIWEGDREDLDPVQPSLRIDFTVTGICPPNPPFTSTNAANLQYPSCGLNISDAASMLINDSPVDSVPQVFSLAPGQTAPFETGRSDTDLGTTVESNEGEPIVFRAAYPFPNGYAGQWDDSSFSAEMGTGTAGLTGEPLQLSFNDVIANDVPDMGEITGVTVEVINNNGGGTSFPRTNLPVGALTDPGVVVINANGSITIPDLDFIGDFIGDTSMSNMELIIEYVVTAPEGNLDVPGTGLPVDDDNVGSFEERVTLSVTNDNTSCLSTNDFTQGIGVVLARARVNNFGDVDAANDAGACGVTTATLNVFGPSVASALRADNVRIQLQSTDYDLPTLATDFSFGGAGNLSGLGKNFTLSAANGVIEVTPDTDNLTGLSTITFPISLNPAATGRVIQASVFYDSNHTSPDYAPEGTDEDYSDGPFALFVPVPTANLDVEFFPPSVILGDPAVFADVDGAPGLEGVFSWRVRITNIGTTTLSDYVFTNEVPPGFLPYRAGSSPAADAGLLTDPVMVWTGLPALTPGASIEINVAIGLAANAGCNVGTPNQSTVYFGCTAGTVLYNEAGPSIDFPVIDLELEHRDTSYCELCRAGTVELEVRNEGASDLYNLFITEELAGAGLEYVPGSGFVTFEGGSPIALEPTLSGTQLIWDNSNLGALINTLRPGEPHLFSDLNGTPSELVLSFDLRSSDANPEDLLSASKQITASAQFDLFCGNPGLAPVVDNFTVPLRQPQPTLDKQGRNYSARQNDTQYADPVFGGTDDVLVWRVDVQNSGITSSADLEDLLVNDTIGGNFTLRYVCPTEVAADAMAAALETEFFAANPAPPPVAPCITYIPSLDVDDPFGNPANDEPGAFIDVEQGTSAFTYYVGEILAFCVNQSNAANIEWGCENSPAPGGVNDSTPGVVGADDSDDALMSTEVDPSGVLIAQTVTGVNTAQPVGTKGMVTITISNNSGGTIRLGEDPVLGDLVLEDILPQDYELDPEWFATHPDCTDRLAIITAYTAGYPGQVDTCTHDNVGDPDGFTQPEFKFTSTSQGTPNQINLLRHGDQLVLEVGIIRVRPFDDTADPEIREENVATATDPDYSGAYTNDLRLDFANTCSTSYSNDPAPQAVTVNPEDLDVDINEGDPDLFYILADPAATLQMNVRLRNRGGHDATDYDLYVTAGEALNVVSIDAGGGACTQLTPVEEAALVLPPPLWNPATSNVYRCINQDPLAPAAFNDFQFVVERDVPDTTGDLTFRADVIGRTTQFDGNTTTLGAAEPGFPNYSLDNILARIIGFAMSKTLLSCNEVDSTDPRVMIGEECTYRIEAEWFGFATPGFGSIEVRNASIFDGAPGTVAPPQPIDGQGTIGNPNTSGSSPGVTIGTQTPANPVADLSETGFRWDLATIFTNTGSISESFIADITFRTLNDSLNASALPNLHDTAIINEANARFEVFFPDTGSVQSFDETSAGYPPVADRQATITVAEPNLVLVKEVCNLTRSGGTCDPGDFLPSPPGTPAVFGDADDQFVYRLTLTNQPAGGPRAPAYDVTVTDVLDALDQMTVLPFDGDGLDNDGDATGDGVDTDEGSVADNIPENATPAEITFAPTHSTALQRINSGASVQLFYRTQLTGNVVPGQELVNTVGGVYDSLAGDFGSQSAPQRPTGDIGGARRYTVQDQAAVEIDDVVISPGSKEFLTTSRRQDIDPGTPCTLPCVAEDVVIGEEVLVQLEFTVPVSTLDNFTVVDNLPAGIACVEAIDVNLPVFPGTDPGFLPGGVFAAATCDGNTVSWDFGDQQLLGGGATTQYTVQTQFIARVENVIGNDDMDTIINGGGALVGTDVFVTYNDVGGTQVQIPIEQAALTVREPDLQITKTMVPVLPNTTVDAVDRFNVTVDIENSGLVSAYNIQLLDTLDPNLSFVVGSVGGANPPDTVDLSVPATPRFDFNEVGATTTFSFTYQVQADSDVRPLEVLSNTIDARFTSLPSNNIALNATDLIGPDGAGDGMRVGFLPPASGTDPLNDYEAQAVDSETVPGLTLLKDDLTPAVVMAIGARKQFQLVLGLPESIADAVVVSDNLANGDTSFVLENDATFDVVYTFQGIVSINGSPVAGLTTPAAVEAALAGFTAVDEATGTVTWNFGTVVTANEDDSTVNNINPQIVIEYYARVANNPATVTGTDLQNAARVDYTDGETGNPAPPVDAPPLGPFPVAEPDFQVQKDFVDLPLPTPANTVIQGQPAEFIIQATNTGSSTAWDTTIVDMLPNAIDGGAPGSGGMCDNAPVISQIEVAGRALTAGSDYTTAFVSPDPATANLYCSYTIMLTPSATGDADARIQPGEILLIRYSTTLDSGTPGNSSLTNVAGVTRWFSLDTDGVTVPPEIRQYDRTLTLRPDPDPGTSGIIDYQDPETVQTLSPVIDVTKSVQNLTAGQNPALTASPGDTLRYSIVIENTGPVDAVNVQVTDDPETLNDDALFFPDGYFENLPGGTLRNVTVSVTATDNSQSSGGDGNSGVLDVSAITVPAGGSVTVSFDIDVEDPNTPLPHTFIQNRARVELPGFDPIDSNITQTEIINIATGFEFDKESQDLSGDPTVLLAGDTLRYTVTIRNQGVNDPLIGIMHAENVRFRDQVPAHSTYVANSTRLNGAPVADSSPGVPPFIDGMEVHSSVLGASGNGLMLASRDALDIGINATVTFDVTINAGLVNGTVISNHALLTGEEQAIGFPPLPFPAVVSDDPATVSVPNDPTQNTVGSGVNIDSMKTVRPEPIGDSIADTGEVLLYTIVVINSGNATANNVILIDPVPAGTTYVPDSVTLNGNPINDVVPGISPLSAGMGISSIDLLPNTGTPMAPPANGQLSSSPDTLGNERAAIVTFQVTITAAAGSMISNQGTVRSIEQPDEPTDADGNDENGDQPTRVIVGGAAELEITKEVVVVGGGTAQPNGELEYRIRIENTGSVPADDVVVTDTMPGSTAFLPGSARIDGVASTDPDVIVFASNTLTVDYNEFYGRLLEPGDFFMVTFRVTIGPGVPPGFPIDNTAEVQWDGGNAEDTANIDVGGAPGVINLNGGVWDNRDLHDDAFGAGEVPLAGWRVRVYVNNNNPVIADIPLAETLTDVQGLYRFTGLAPVDSGDADGAYTLTFSAPVTFPAGGNVGLGDTESDFGITGLMITNNLNVPAGRNAQDENLPVDPMGVVYNSVSRQPVQGARVRLYAGNNPVSTACFTTPDWLDSQQGQITSAFGFYRFDLNFSDADCPPAGANFVIRVEMPLSTGGFLTRVSEVIPPEVGILDVAACPGTAFDRMPVPPPADTCEVQEEGAAPAPSVLPGLDTRYFPNVNLESGPEELLNNHLPVDDSVGEILAITKQTPLKNVTRGQLVPYTITVTNNQTFPVSALEIRDFFPPGFKYITGSAVIDGQPVEPLADASTFNDESLRAGTLTWSGLSLQPNDVLTLKLLLVVGSGVGEGEYINQAQAFITGFPAPVSGRASATVRVVPDPTFDCSDVIGKVYDDRNANGYQDEGEAGIAGARIATVQGLLSTTDKYGRFHITCAVVPDPDRGSNFILKLDERSLPSGYRVTTENPRVQRVTRGKVAKFNFGVTLHRVVRLDLADQAFEFGGTAIQEHWGYVLDDLFTQLQERPSILRITYLVEAESEALTQQRLQAVRDSIAARWKEMNCCYDLKIEVEIFWRTGSPQ